MVVLCKIKKGVAVEEITDVERQEINALLRQAIEEDDYKPYDPDFGKDLLASLVQKDI